MKRELIYMDSKSSKFWNIEVKGASFTVTYGRTGSDGQTQTKDFGTEEAARKAAEALIREKLGKGYVYAAASGAGAAASGSTADADGSIPLIAFSSINRREDISNNAGTFVGRRVVDYDQEKPVRTDVVSLSLGLGWKGDSA